MKDFDATQEFLDQRAITMGEVVRVENAFAAAKDEKAADPRDAEIADLKEAVGALATDLRECQEAIGELYTGLGKLAAIVETKQDKPKLIVPMNGGRH